MDFFEVVKQKGEDMEENKNNRKERKKQLTIWLPPSLMDKIETLRIEDNCDSKSEFIEKAVQFYIGYLSCKENRFFLPNTITSTMKSIVNESANQQRTLLFKMAVEIAIMENIIALNNNLDEVAMQRLRGYCIDEVKKSNGMLSYEDVLKSLYG